MQKKRLIFLLLTLYIVVASVYGVVTPVMEASDELWHYPMVKYIADHWALPVQKPGVETAWRQEGSQPPLYYALSAMLTFWIDTSDLDQVRWINPHADNGIIRPDGNGNLIVHRAEEQFPWQGTVLAIHLIRFLSVGMGAGTVYLTYRLVLELWPKRDLLALIAASVTAFNPMFAFISGSVNNDNLAMLLGAAGIWLIVRLVRQHDVGDQVVSGAWWRDVTLLGVVLGSAMLTKVSTAGLLFLTALAIGYVSWKRRSWKHFFSGGFVTAGMVLLIAGWWFVRNAVLYDGDWTGIDRFIVILGYRDPPATLRQLWGERYGFMMAFWGLFGGVNVPMPDWIYRVLNGTAVLSAVGLVIGLANKAIRDWQGWRRHEMLLLLVVLWPVTVVLPWISWATRTWSSQGRLVFSAMSAWSTWFVLGLSALVPRRRTAWIPGLVGCFLLGVAAWAPWGVIAPTYRVPGSPSEIAPDRVLEADVGGELRLLGYDLETVSAQPGGQFRFTLYWEAQRDMSRNWSVFCHILDQHTGLPLTTRDRYPGQGLLATSLMVEGQRWSDRYVVDVPQTAYAPSDVLLEVGLYDAASGERPPVLVERGEYLQVVDNALRFQPMHIEPREGSLPNPVRINFQDQIALVGWDVDQRVVAPGSTVHLTLFWECTDTIRMDYSVFTQLLDESEQKWAQWDSWPANSATSTWEKGQQFEDHYALQLDANAPPGAKRLVIGIYGTDDAGTLERLRIIDDQGRVLPEDRVVLDQLLVSMSTGAD